MMQRAAVPAPKALASKTFPGITLDKWTKITGHAANSGIPIGGFTGSFSLMGNTVHWSLIGTALTIDVMEAAIMNPEDVLSFVSDMINQAIA